MPKMQSLHSKKYLLKLDWRYRCSLMFLLVLSLTACGHKRDVYLFTSFHEPATAGLRMLYSYNGYEWHDLDTVLLKPAVGTQRVMRDPSLVQGKDGTYHLVWTSSWKEDYGFGYASSTDLVHWSPQKHIVVMAHEPTTVNVWAPELYFDKDEDRFIIVWASTIPYRFEKGMEDEGNNHRLYYVTTKDFNTFTPTALFYDPGYSVIDATIVRRGPQDYVLVFKDNTRPVRALKVAFGNSPLGPWTNDSKPFTGFLTEGPTVVKLGAKWHIFYDDYQNHVYDGVNTLDFESFESLSDDIHFPAGHKHGTVLTVNRKTFKKLMRTLAIKPVKEPR